MELNHVLVYVRDLEAALRFYEGKLGFVRVAAEDGYARLRVPGGDATLALHAETGDVRPPWNEGIALYFEAEELDELCARLAASGVPFDQPPREMQWGWRHAYLRDPDGHRLSFYRAGASRLG